MLKKIEIGLEVSPGQQGEVVEKKTKNYPGEGRDNHSLAQRTQSGEHAAIAGKTGWVSRAGHRGRRFRGMDEPIAPDRTQTRARRSGKEGNREGTMGQQGKGHYGSETTRTWRNRRGLLNPVRHDCKCAEGHRRKTRTQHA